MINDSNARQTLHDELQKLLTQDSAALLMDSIPIAAYSEIALRDDVVAATVAVRADMETMRDELRGETQTLGTELHSEIQTLGTELRSETQTLGTELRSETQTLGTELHSEIQTLGTELRTESLSLRADMTGEVSRLDARIVDTHFQTTMAINQISTDVRRLFLMQMTVMVALFGIVIALIGAG